jgi:hypothetical protein
MNKNLFCEVLKIIFLFFLFFFFMILIVKFIKYKDPICDSEKQSKFILECLKADTTKDVRAISACEQMSIRLYCK